PPPPPPPPPPPADDPTDTAAIDLVPGDCPEGTTPAVIDSIDLTGVPTTIGACEISGAILTDLTLPGDTGFALSGPVFVGSDTGVAGGVSATLTVEPGTIVFGSSGSDFLVVSRGSQIIADGTVDSPIVFTSNQDVGAGGVDDGLAPVPTSRGQWGGLVISGFAPQNDCIDAAAVGGSAECEASGEGDSGLYGGDQPDDDSGVLDFVRVQFAGFQVNDEDELNGIAFQAVGSGGSFTNLQVHNNEDDGIEFFGGTANISNVALTGIADDSLDYTDGWVGNAQFVVVAQAADAADNGFEFDNLDGANDTLPRSNPTISNFTLVGQAASAESDLGMLIREGTAGTLVNGVVVDFNDAGLDIDNIATVARIGASDAPGDEALVLQSILFDNAENFNDDAGALEGEPDDLADVEVDTADIVADAIAAGDFVDIVEVENTLADTFFPGPAEFAVPVVDPTTLGSFFEPAPFIGALGPDETLVDNRFADWTIALLPDVTLTCPVGTTENADSPLANDGLVCTLPSLVVGDLVLPAGPLYELDGPTFVGVDLGPDPADPLPTGIEGSLTIAAGATVFGASGSDFLVVTRGSQLFSNGTSVSPVVYTSSDDLLDGSEDDGFVNGTITTRGQWGGLILNGRAPQNDCIDAAALGGSVDCEASGEGDSGLYGGATVDDDSGNIFFSRVQFAGFQVNDEDELNGIAFQAIGNGGVYDSIQVHNNEDDGIEFFGGTADLKRALLTGIADDSLDYTDGWVGNAQFVIVQQLPDAADNGFEFDNLDGANDTLPRSNPTISNFTLVGQPDSAESDLGMLIREGTAGTLVNGIVLDFNDAGLDIDNIATVARIGASDAPGDEALVLQSILFDNAENFNDDSGAMEGEPDDLADVEVDTGVLVADALAAGDFVDIVEGETSLTGRTFVLDASALEPGASEAAVPVVDPTAFGSFFEPVTVIGALQGPDDTSFDGWTLIVPAIGTTPTSAP
ncbi:MAG: hypothetical protein ACFB2Z_09460, partial [Maricaulaceae bacterium]